MNQYATMALRHWQRWLPRRYQAIPDPMEFFSRLGEQVAARIENLTEQLAGPDRPGESYLDKVGRLTSARQQAEEMVLPELVLPAPEPDTETSPQPADQQRSGPGQTMTDSGWIPVVEDPNHPFWQQNRRDEP